MRVRIARDELRRIRELSQTIKALERRDRRLVATVAPQLLTEPGFGPLTAAKLVGEVAGAGRFSSDAKLAAPPASLRFRSVRARPTATAWTAAATARSTPPSTASPSPACAATPRRRTTSPANAPKARHQGSDPLPQTPPRTAHLAPAPATPPRPRNTAIPINPLT